MFKPKFDVFTEMREYKMKFELTPVAIRHTDLNICNGQISFKFNETNLKSLSKNFNVTWRFSTQKFGLNFRREICSCAAKFALKRENRLTATK